jgi:hypothetical protein
MSYATGYNSFTSQYSLNIQIADSADYVQQMWEEIIHTTESVVVAVVWSEPRQGVEKPRAAVWGRAAESSVGYYKSYRCPKLNCGAHAQKITSI